MNNWKGHIGIFLLVSLLLSCQSTKEEVANSSDMAPKDQTLDWVKDATIYELNIRQYTPEGTFTSILPHLKRIEEMGVEIIWLMPIYPISSTKRKGSLGSYYAISDYTGVNAEFGSEEEFRIMIDSIHALGMHVILDWVPNHTGWDHKWIEEHPSWYSHQGDTICHPYLNGEPTDWYDVADLNYENAQMRQEMIKSMKYWVEAYDVDGFRCDVAFAVPDSFWLEVKEGLSEVKPLFMLAEAEHSFHLNQGIFQANYAWNFMHLSVDMAKGEKNVSDLVDYIEENAQAYDLGYPMYFTSNHDENSWNGTVFERYGNGHKAFAALAFSLEGIPLIYSGQEEPLTKRLAFFEKDTIGFSTFKYASFYQALINFKRNNPALWNGASGGKLEILHSSDKVLCIERKKQGNEVLSFFNLSSESVDLPMNRSSEGFVDFMGQTPLEFSNGDSIRLTPWEFRLLSKHISE